MYVLAVMVSKKCSKPFSSTHINLLPLLKVIHNIVNAPRFELIALRIIRRNALIFFQFDPVLDILHALLIVLMRIPFGIMLPDPFWQARRRLSRVDLDLGPVCLLQQLGVGEADLLSAGRAGESERIVSQCG